MNASEKNSFEEQWRDAFENAELTPDPTIWATIETQLADAETNKYKRKLYVFKLRVAAAAALLILALGSWMVWQSQQLPQGESVLAHQPAVSASTDPSAVASDNEQQVSEPSSLPKTATQTATTKKSDSDLRSTQETSATQTTHSSAAKSQRSNLPIPVDGNSIASDTKTPSVGSHPTNNSVAQARQKRSGAPRNSVESVPVDLTEESVAYAPKLRNSEKANTAVKNSISKNAKTPDGITAPAEEQTLAQNDIASPLPAVSPASSVVSINALMGRGIAAQQARMPQKEIRWQLNQMYWDQVIAADVKSQEEKASKKSRWQVGAGITPGSFNPNFSTDGSQMSYASSNYGFSRNVTNVVSSNVLADQTGLNKITTPGISYNTGIQAEFALSERWSVQGGVQYTYNQSQIQTLQYISVANTESIQPTFYSLLSKSSPVQSNNALGTSLDAQNTNYAYTTAVTTGDAKPLNNVYQYMGIPVRMLYRVFNKKLKASVGAGVSTDLFLRNRISSDEANIQSLEINRSENSIYKNMSMSGLLSVKLDYTLGNHYSIYLEPTYRRAITSFTTSSTLASYPSWWGVGTGVQYRF